MIAQTAPLSGLQIVRLFGRLRWRLLRGAIRHGGTHGFAVIIGIVASVLIGLIGGGLIASMGHVLSDPDPLLITLPVAIGAAIVALGVIAGVAQPVDPRIIATEPLTDRQLGVGLLTTSAFGPPGIAATMLGLGMFAGSVSGWASVPICALATLAFLATLLLISRTTVNLLGIFANRFSRLGQVLVGAMSLAFYGALQFISATASNLDQAGRQQVADVARLTPPGQVGEAFALADEQPLAALGHLALGALWLPLLAMVFMTTTRRVLASSGSASQRTGGSSASAGRVAALARRMCGAGPVGTVAWRSVRTRIRHPRTALETFVGAGLGLAVVLFPALIRDGIGAAAVLAGGAVQLSVLLMAGNSIGSDGPALGSEIMCGVEPETIIAGKVRSVLVVASPLVIIGPLIGAAATGEWEYLPAGFAVGLGGLFSGAGGAIVQSTLVPIAVPESDNPLASGDSGQGVLAAVVLAVVLIVLALITLPVALGLLWALERDSIGFVTLFAVAAIGGGWLVMQLGQRTAARRWRQREPEIYDSIIPAN
jgi:hypothetical protein